MDVYPIEKDEVMVLRPRVEEAQRQAKNEMKDMVLGNNDRRQKKMKSRRKGDDRDKEEV